MIQSKQIQGILWFLCSVVACNVNDVLAKHLGQGLPAIEVTCLRFALSALVLVPFILSQGLRVLKTQHLGMHCLRGLLIAVAILMWVKGLKQVPITTATTISFAMPLFTLPIAFFFLKENVTWKRWLATLIGFGGVIVVMKPQSLAVGSEALCLLASAVIFSILDVVNKRFVCRESMLSMLFYPGLVAALLVGVPAYQAWVMPTGSSLLWLGILACGSNLILYFILKAFALVEASFVSPFRYTEILVSAAFGFFLFNEVPAPETLIGCAVIIASTLYVTCAELQKSASSPKPAVEPAQQGV